MLPAGNTFFRGIHGEDIQMKKLLFIAVLFLYTGAVNAVAFSVSWDASPPALQVTHYLCEKNVNDSVWVSCPADIVGVITIQEVLAAPGDKVAFHVKACNFRGCSLVWSVEGSAIYPPDLVPGTVLNINVTANGDVNININTP